MIRDGHEASQGDPPRVHQARDESSSEAGEARGERVRHLQSRDEAIEIERRYDQVTGEILRELVDRWRKARVADGDSVEMLHAIDEVAFAGCFLGDEEVSNAVRSLRTLEQTEIEI